MFRSNCLVCESSNIKKIIDLGLHPFADTFLKKDDFFKADNLYPLICDLCLECGQVQTKCVTDPKERYQSHDYSYTSSNSNTAKAHWKEYALEVSRRVNLSREGMVVEIGSNDGFLSEQFRFRGNKTIGVDPSKYMAKLAEERGIKTFIELFTPETAKKIISQQGKAELVVANNVFNHSDSPLNFAKGVSELLSKDGTFVYEMPYWYISMKEGKFDQIYHEHVSYFTVKSSIKLLEVAGLTINDVEVVDYHGGSLRVYAKHKENTREICKKALEMIAKEEEFGLFELGSYKKIMNSIVKKRNQFLEKIHHLKNNGSSIVAVGAAAKGNTLLNFYKLDNKIIDYVTDSSPHKQNKYTPGTRIPIVGDDIFSNYGEVYALILSWNISEPLKKILSEINPQIKFISPWID